MTIEHRGVVDFIGQSKKDGKLHLTISDHLDWENYDSHTTAIHNKINDYLEYIYINNLHEESAGSGRRNIRIQLIMKHEPTERARELLDGIGARLGDLGFEFHHRVFSEEGKPK